jgi:hypothetical protein
MNATNDRAACPFLQEVVMIYCDACPRRKLLPRNQVVSLGPCCSADYATCPLFREIAGGLVPPQTLATEVKP